MATSLGLDIDQTPVCVVKILLSNVILVHCTKL